MTRPLSLLACLLLAAPALADPRTDLDGNPLPDGALARLSTWAGLAALWAALLVSAWMVFAGGRTAPPSAQDCLTTSNGERAQTLRKRGYQVVSDDVAADGTRTIVVCR